MVAFQFLMINSFVVLFVVSVQSIPNDDVENVHVIFANHLDVGFGNFAINIINSYFQIHFPTAVSICNQLNSDPTRYVYTTHAWLVSLYLDCNATKLFPRNSLLCPIPSEVQLFVDAIKNGQITWHGFPFNSQLSLMDAAFIQAAVSSVHDLDARFNLSPKKTLSQRDVPGITLGALDALNQAGISAISVGVNGGSAPPAVPNLFVWKNPTTGASTISMWNPGGYGDLGTYVTFPGFTEALAFAWRGDNEGPGSVNEIRSDFDTIGKIFPNAKVFGSTFDNFVEKLQPIVSKLPVVTSEIGDSWMYGVPSDPWKTQMWREISRIHSKHMAEKKMETVDYSQFYRLILKASEHTWGLDVKTYLHDTNNWANEDFQKIRKSQNFQDMESSWSEQREYIYDAIKVLGSDPLAQEITNAINALRVTSLPSLSGYQKVQNWNSSQFSCGDLSFRFGTNGGISSLRNTKSNQVWASDDHVLGEYIYTTHNSTDYLNFIHSYSNCAPSVCKDWIFEDFGKPNVSVANPVSGKWMGNATMLYSYEDTNVCSYYLEILLPTNLHTTFGAPSSVWMRTNFTKNGDSVILIDFFVYDKTPTRLPESHWFGFHPVLSEPGGSWTVDKCGQAINPLNVVKNGSMHIHGQTNGISYTSNTTSLLLEALDVSVVSIGAPIPFPTPFEIGKPENGLFFNFCNNIWGTNYIMWYPWLDEDANSLYRFKLTMK